MEQNSPNDKLNILMKYIFDKCFKPKGYRKEKNNFRLYQEDGLCKIVNFQKNSYNTKDECSFTINIGVYFEKNKAIKNLKFKEYDCQIRARPASFLSKKDDWWIIDCKTSIDKTIILIENLVNEIILNYFEEFCTKDITIEKIINGNAQELSDTNILCYDTVKLLIKLGYNKEMLYYLENNSEFNNNELFQTLIKEIKV